ncbi:MAG: mevalonate kinase [Deltaproteobacteria bacterium RBG_16_71_12]|nr:MAG: mevalonate kinase [Deltaproteobacteria bacterium RBG_16_71_12]
MDAVFGYAPGKVILFGEHAVVYGQPAIAGTIDRGIRVAVSQKDGDGADGPLFKSHSMAMRARPDPHGEGPESLRKALGVLVDLYGERVRRLIFSAEGTIPAGAGLGSSAALSVALLRGVQRVLGEPALGGDALVERAFALERVFHGNPSGVDHTTIALGGCIAYRRAPAEGGHGGAIAERLTLPRRLRLAVAVAGSHGGTAQAVAALRERARRHQDAYQRIYQGIGELAAEGRAALEAGALAAVGELMDLNQGYLNALGVSTPAIEALCATARERGALGAKLSGAGGGGAVIALVEDDPAPVVRAFEAHGVPCFATEIVDGIGLEAA